MKKILTRKYHGLALAALLLGSASLAFAQTTDTNFNTFDTGTVGVPPDGTGLWYGSSAIAFDTPDNSGNGGGSMYVDATFGTGSDTPLTDWVVFPPYDNLWWNGNGNIPLSQYSAVQFDIMWDPTSTLTIDQFNDLTLLQPSLAGSIPGLEVGVAGLGNPWAVLAITNIPAAAATGWATMTIPINPSQPGIDGAAGIIFHKWINNNGSISGSYDFKFWIDNVRALGTAAPPPPPTITPLRLPTPGLNQVFNTAGQFDRHEVALVSSNGLSWVGNATTGNPVTYSFTINDFPKNVPAFSTAAYLMMSPNPAFLDNALDWNETNCVVLWLQQGDTNTQMQFLYKTNLPGAATGTLLGTVTNNGSALGTWSVTFTSDTAGTLTAPDNSQVSFTFPSDATAMFAENPAVGQPGFYLYLGGQPNHAVAQNQAICYSRFSVSGVPSAQTNNFLADTVLNTNIWRNGPGSGSPNGNFINPTNAAYWIKWTTPASGYSLQSATSLSGTWTALTDGPIISGSGAVQQLVTTNDVPVGTSASFFRLIKP